MGGELLVFKNIKKLLFTNFIGKILGFVREVLLAFIFGTNSIIDAFKLCNSLVLTPLNLFVGNSLQQIYIPMYNTKNNKVKFVTYVSLLIMLLSLVLCFSTLIFSKEIINLFLNNGYNHEQKLIASNFLKIFALGIPFYVYNWIFIYTLNAQKNFKENGLNVLNFNLVLIAVTSIYFFFKNIYLLPLSFCIANFIIVLQLTLKYKKEFLKAIRAITDINVKHFAYESKSFLIKWSPLLIYTLFMQTYILVERWLLSKDMGLIAASEYAKIITETPVFLITLPMATIGLTYFDKNNASVFRKINKMFLFVCIASLSLGIFIHANQEMIIKILFMRGNFDINSLNLVVSLLQYYSIGFCFYSINTFMFRIYNAEMRNKELSIIVIGAHIITFLLLFTLYFLKIKVDEIVGVSYIIVNLLQTIVLKIRSQSLSIRFCLASLQGKLTVIFAFVIFALLIWSKQYINSSILYFFTSSILLAIIFGVSLNYIRKNEGEI